jgi:nitrilase
MQRIRATAAENHIAVALGYSENENNSLYIAQAYIGSDGTILMNRRKIKPTHLERTVFGDGNGSSLLNVVETPGVGKVGMLSCWEHTQSLLKYHTHSQGEQIHVAAWPPMLPFQEGKGLWSSSAEGEKISFFQFVNNASNLQLKTANRQLELVHQPLNRRLLLHYPL